MRNEIEKILQQVQYGAYYAENKEPYMTNQIELATSQILSLLEGSLPEGKENVVFMEKHTDRYEKTEEYHLRDKKGIAYIAYGDGWNACLEAIKEKMK